MGQMQKKKPAFSGFGGGGNSGLAFGKTKPIPKKTDIEKFDEAEKKIQEKEEGGCGCW